MKNFTLLTGEKRKSVEKIKTNDVKVKKMENLSPLTKAKLIEKDKELEKQLQTVRKEKEDPEEKAKNTNNSSQDKRPIVLTKDTQTVCTEDDEGINLACTHCIFIATCEGELISHVNSFHDEMEVDVYFSCRYCYLKIWK